MCLRAVEVEPDQYYSYFLDLIKNLMYCSIESSQYEDTLREMYGINSYTAFTMDKQVQQIVRTVSAAIALSGGCQNGGCLCIVMLSGVVRTVVDCTSCCLGLSE